MDDEGISVFPRQKALEDLTITGPVSDKGFEAICKNTTLKSLTLIGGTLTDDSLAQVKLLANLEKLELLRCPELTDEALPHLKRLPKLKSLNLKGSA